MPLFLVFNVYNFFSTIFGNMLEVDWIIAEILFI